MNWQKVYAQTEDLVATFSYQKPDREGGHRSQSRPCLRAGF